MKSSATILLLILVVGFSSCKKEEADGPYYSWKGRLFKGTSDEPVRNTEIWLQSYIHKGIQSVPDIETVAITHTDENGYFELKYPRVNWKWHENGEAGGMWLLRGPFPQGVNDWPVVTYYPWNKFIHKDFSEDLHCRLVFDITINSAVLPDSLYYGFQDPLENEYSRNFYFPNVNYTRKIFVVPVTGRHMVLHNKSYWSGTRWDNKPSTTLWCTYGVSKEDFLLANSNPPNQPGTYNAIPYAPRGFPKVDTIKIVIP